MCFISITSNVWMNFDTVSNESCVAPPAVQTSPDFPTRVLHIAVSWHWLSRHKTTHNSVCPFVEYFVQCDVRLTISPNNFLYPLQLWRTFEWFAKTQTSFFVWGSLSSCDVLKSQYPRDHEAEKKHQPFPKVNVFFSIHPIQEEKDLQHIRFTTGNC